MVIENRTIFTSIIPTRANARFHQVKYVWCFLNIHWKHTQVATQVFWKIPEVSNLSNALFVCYVINVERLSSLQINKMDQ